MIQLTQFQMKDENVFVNPQHTQKTMKLRGGGVTYDVKCMMMYDVNV